MLQSAPLDCSLADLAVGGLASAADVLVAKGNRVLAHERAGCDEDSRFLLFSLSKVITAAAVLALVDTGAIYLHTRIAALVPEFAAGGKERVTVEDVLTHRGGFSETMSGAHLDLADFADPERMRAAICALPCLPELYGVAVYHPLSYSILGAVVEEASGLSFELWCQQTIFRPLGMAETTWGLPSELRSSAVDLTGSGAGDWDRDGLYTGVVPAGNAWSTADDVSRLFLMLRGGGKLDDCRILEEATVAAMVAPHTDAGGQAGALAFGYGVMIGSDPALLSGRGATASPRCWGHPGFTATQGWCDPDQDLVVVALTNSCVAQDASDLRFQRLADEIRRRYV